MQVRRAICWNDQSLIPYHARGLKRLGGQKKVRGKIGGPWAIRYSLSHLVKDEETLSAADWERTWRILPHGSLAAGFLTGNFDQASISSAASTGIMDLRTGQWCRDMLEALANPIYRDLAWQQLPRIVDQHEPVGPLSAEPGPGSGRRAGRRSSSPRPTISRRGWSAAGRSTAGQLAIILGNSAVVNSSSSQLPGHRQAGCDASELGPLPVDALLHQRRPVPRPHRRQAARLARPGGTGPGRACRASAAPWSCRSCFPSRRWA